MTRLAKVVDASALAAIAFQEPEAAEAEALLKGADIYAPSLLAYELTNIAWKKAQKNPALAEFLAHSLETVLATRIHWAEPVYRNVVSLALETGLSAYDASYLYVARALGAELVTFDGRLRAAARRTR